MATVSFALIPTNREKGLLRREKERIILIKDQRFRKGSSPYV
jgi:hypothetical protein